MSERITRVDCLVAATLILLCGCASTREPEKPSGPHFSVLTYNVNFGGPRPGLAVFGEK